MTEEPEEWRLGNFAKIFSWGSERGFAQFYESIRIGCDLRLEDVRREVFRERLRGARSPSWSPAAALNRGQEYAL